MHRSSTRVVTQDWVNFDGAVHNFENATAPAALSLHWAEGDLLLNVQFDGENAGNGSIKAYLDKLIVYRW